MIPVDELDKLYEEHYKPAASNLFALGTGDIETDKEFYGEWDRDGLRRWYNPVGMMSKLFDVCNMVLLDTPPADDDDAYYAPICLHVRYDSKPIIDTAAALATSPRFCSTSQVWLGGNEGEKRGQTQKYEVFEGAISLRRKLVSAGIRPDRINLAGAVYNTPDEHLEFIRLARENKWPAIHLVGAPYHMVRIALGAIQHMQRENFWTKMYFHAPKVSSWSEQVKGAQGKIIADGQRYNQLVEEFVRIPEYQIKAIPDLSTFEEAIAYFLFGRESIIEGQLMKPLELDTIEEYEEEFA